MKKTEISSEDVRAAYELILGRAPENEQVVAYHLENCASPADLYGNLCNSPEFKLLKAGKECSPADINLLRRYMVCNPVLNAEYQKNSFGLITCHRNIPWSKGAIIATDIDRLALPVPDDGFASETIEYLALCDAMSKSPPNRFVAMEFGAGWGPWISLGGVIARNQKKSDIKLVGVEASRERTALMQAHMASNGLCPEGSKLSTVTTTETGQRISVQLINGAIGSEDGYIQFANHDVSDMGAVAFVDSNYRNMQATEKIKLLCLEKLLEGFDSVDFMHIDIQGSELELCSRNIKILSRKASALFIGTHSRMIEARLIDLFYENGWTLIKEKPCKVNWQKKTDKQTLEAMTIKDGGQYWRRNA